MTTIIIFSKNRAMQLEALLYSINKFCTNVGQIYCLYKATTQDFSSGYIKILGEEDYSVRFYAETKFKQDLITILNQIKSKNVLVCCDDVIFIDKVDLNIFNKQKLQHNTFNFCLGNNITWSNPKQTKQIVPEHTIDGEVIKWNWKTSEYDWGYPNSIGCSIYRTWWIKLMAKLLSYDCPNWFEGKLNNKRTKLFTPSINLAYKTSKVKCIQLNQVQSVYKFQEGLPENSPPKLNNLFLNGYVIDSSNIENNNSQFVFNAPIIKIENRK